MTDAPADPPRALTHTAAAGPPAARFVVFEGGEGSGKSTQCALLRDHLEGRGHEVVVTREPGGTELGRTVRGVLLGHAEHPVDPRAEALLYAADRAQHVAELIRPALDRGAVVVSDRYVDSSLAYQGAGRALASDDVAALSAWATGGLVPALTVVLDLPPVDGLARAGRVDAPDRLESEPLAFHERVRAGFLALAARAPERYVVIDALQPREAVAAAVARAVDAALTGAPA